MKFGFHGEVFYVCDGQKQKDSCAHFALMYILFILNLKASPVCGLIPCRYQMHWGSIYNRCATGRKERSDNIKCLEEGEGRTVRRQR